MERPTYIYTDIKLNSSSIVKCCRHKLWRKSTHILCFSENHAFYEIM